MASDAQFSPKSRAVTDIEQRIERLRSYAEHFGYMARSLEARCSASEWQRLKDLRVKIANVRAEVEGFIHEHKREE